MQILIERFNALKSAEEFHLFFYSMADTLYEMEKEAYKECWLSGDVHGGYSTKEDAEKWFEEYYYTEAQEPPAKKLQSLEGFNEKNQSHTSLWISKAQPNGIACPRCGAELLDSTPNTILTTNPPKMAIHCDDCGYKDFRIS